MNNYTYIKPGQLFAWNHPFDIHFGVKNLLGWPKALLKVWRLDSSNKIDACSYGTVQFPRSAGFSEISWYSCRITISETWTPTGENIDVLLRKQNDDLATNLDPYSRFDRSLDWRF